MLKVITVTDRGGQRLDNFLIRVYKKTPKQHVYRMIRKGRIRINGSRCRQHHYVLLQGDQLEIPVPHYQAEDHPPSDTLCEKIKDSIAHDYPDFWVIDKPAGISVHQSNDELHGVVEVMRHLYGNADLVHRIDRGTTGCLIVAKNYSAMVELASVWKNRNVNKSYLALLDGVPHWNSMSVNQPLKRLMNGKDLDRVIASEDGQVARSMFTITQRFQGSALASVDIDTGRTHQIRVHAQFLGYPICGDRRYNLKNGHQFSRMFLHASRLQFSYRDSHYDIQLPLPKDQLAVLARLN
ncbi:RluA family pseudouridine synthase [Gammaproteobacteria bacterium]|nr:RluA family pseudouridine synthase [Gammaproteobacteria bacterium]